MADCLSTCFDGENTTTGSNNNNNHATESVEGCAPMQTELGTSLNREPFSGYFTASKDGEGFVVLDGSTISEALSQGFSVYYVDQPWLDFTSVSGATIDGTTAIDVANRSQSLVLTDSSTGLLLFNPSESLANKLTGDQPAVTFTNSLPEPPQQHTQNILSDSANAAIGSTSELGTGTGLSHVPPQNFECDVCHLALKSTKELRQHTKTHEDEKPYTCSHCSVGFNHLENLKIHVTISHTITKGASPPYACPLCDVQLARYTAFRSHVLLHQLDENLMCHSCRRLFPSHSLLNAHQATEHSSDAPDSKFLKQYRCQLCRTVLFSLGNLFKHYRANHPDEIRCKRRIPVVVDSTGSAPPVTESPEVPRTGSDCDVRTSKLRAKAYLASLKLTGSRKKTNQACVYDHMIGVVNSTEPDPVVNKNNSHESGASTLKQNSRSCPLCKKRFLKPYLVRRHMLQHTRPKPFECLLCHARFAHKWSARAHMATHSNASVLFCPLCSRQFARKHNLLAHLARAHSDVSVQFTDEPVTGEQLPIEANPCDALDYPHVVYAYPPSTTGTTVCFFATPPPTQPVCNVQRSAPDQQPFTQLPEPAEIIELEPQPAAKCVRPQRSFVCYVCQKSFSSSRTLSVHLLRHSSAPLPYNCPQCSRRFASRSHQRYHINTHHTREFKQRARSEWLARRKILQPNVGGPLKWNSVRRRFQYTARDSQGPHQCNQCTKAYRNVNHLRAHIRQQHNTSLAPFACTVCARRFVTEAALGRHMKRGHKRTIAASRVVCPICELSFANANSMKRHWVVHSNDRPYRCAWCQKAFKFHSSCSKHMKTRVCQSRLVNQEVDSTVALGLGEQNNFEVFASTSYDDDLVARIPHSKSTQQFDLSSSVLIPDPDNIWSNAVNFSGNPSSSSSNNHLDVESRFWPVRASLDQNNNHMDLIDTVYHPAKLVTAPYPSFALPSSSADEKFGADYPSNSAPEFSTTIDWTNETTAPVLLDSGTTLNANGFLMESFSPVVQVPATLQSQTVSLNSVQSCVNTTIMVEPPGTHGYTNLLMGTDYTRDSMQIVDLKTVPWSYVTTADNIPPVVVTESGYHQLTESTDVITAPHSDETCADFIHDHPPRTSPTTQHANRSDHLNAEPLTQTQQQQQQPNIESPPPPPFGLKIASNAVVPSSESVPEASGNYFSPPAETTNQLPLRTDPEPVFGCSRCPAAFMDANDLLVHSHTAHSFHEQSHVVCQLCYKTFASETLLLAHGQSHTKCKPCSFICPVCPDAVFNNQSGLTRHINSCHPPPNSDRFQCRNCGTRFVQLRSLRSHVATRGQCIGDAFGTSADRAKDHGGSTSPGGAAAATRSTQLRRHYRGVRLPMLKTSDLRSWAQSKPSDDMTLSEKFLTKAAAELVDGSISAVRSSFSSKDASPDRRNEAADLRPKRHRCPVCAQPFRLASDLKRHMCRHTGDRPYKCTQCDRQYIKHHQLRQHQLKAHAASSPVHHEVTNSAHLSSSSSSCRAQFTCHICHRMYTGKFNLLRHVRLHVTRRRFECPHCHRKFTTSSRKRLHVRCCPVAQDIDYLPVNTGLVPIGTASEPTFLEQLNNDSMDRVLESAAVEGPTPGTAVTVVDLDQEEPDHAAAEAAASMNQPMLLSCTFPLTTQSVIWNVDTVSLSIPYIGDYFPSGANNTPIPTIKTEPGTDSCNVLVTASVTGHTLQRYRQTHPTTTLSNVVSHAATALVGFTELTRCETCRQEFRDLASYRKHDCRPTTRMIDQQRCFTLEQSTAPDGCYQLAGSDQAKRSSPGRRISTTTSCVLQALHKCASCDRVFHQIASLKQHEATVHGASKSTFSCETCGATFTKQSSLTNHELIHKGVKPFRCSRCAMRFRQRSNLRRHMRALHP